MLSVHCYRCLSPAVVSTLMNITFPFSLPRSSASAAVRPTFSRTPTRLLSPDYPMLSEQLLPPSLPVPSQVTLLHSSLQSPFINTLAEFHSFRCSHQPCHLLCLLRHSQDALVQVSHLHGGAVPGLLCGERHRLRPLLREHESVRH